MPSAPSSSRQGFLSCDSLADGLGGTPPEDSSRFRLRLGLKRSRRKAARQRARSLTELPALQPGCPLRRAEFSSAIDPKQRKRDGKETIAVIPPHLQRKAQCRIRHLQSQNFVFKPLQVLEIFRADALTGIDEVQPQRQSSEISGRLSVLATPIAKARPTRQRLKHAFLMPVLIFNSKKFDSRHSKISTVGTPKFLQ